MQGLKADAQAGSGSPTPGPTPGQPLWRRGLPALVLLGLMGLAYGLGLHSYLSLESLARHRGLLGAQVALHPLWMALAFVLLYAGAVAVSFPGATFFTIIGGFLFGGIGGGVLSVVAATLGAAVVFEAARGVFSDSLARRAGPFIAKLQDGFQKDAFNYLLFLRLVPVFPFWLVNIAAGLMGVGRRTFWITTFFGIMPGGIAFAFLGAGLGSVLDAQQSAHVQCVATSGETACPFSLDAASLVTPPLLLALAGLGLVALVPVVLKGWMRRHV